MREDQRLDKTQWGETGRSHARRKAAISAAEQLNEAPRGTHVHELLDAALTLAIELDDVRDGQPAPSR